MSIMKVRPSVRASKAWQGSHYDPSPVTITKPNGEVIVIAQPKRKVAIRNKRKAKAKRNAKNASKPLLTKAQREQIERDIALQERRLAFEMAHKVKPEDYL